MANESAVQIQARLLSAQTGLLMFRNNSGACYDTTGRLIRYGLGNDSEKANKAFKSGDLIGLTSMLISPSMVGRTVGVFTSFECKHADWKHGKKLDEREAAQERWNTLVREAGGFAGFVTGPADIFRIIGTPNV